MKRSHYLSLVALVGLTLFASCGKKKQAEGAETVALDSVKVSTIIAQTQTVADIATYTANVQAEVINQITPITPGRIEKIYVEVGARVGRGQLLVQMESSNLQQQNSQLANLELDYDRYSELLKVGGIAQQQVDQLKTQIDILKTAIKNIETNTQLRSPINGVVTDRNYDNGNVFAQLPILTVQQLNPLKAIINVSESDFSRVKTGMPVTILLDVYGDEQFTGKVSLIYPTIDAATHTFGVEVAINNSNSRVRPGMYARISLNFGNKQSVVIPDVAVQKQAGANDKYVYTVIDGKAHYQKVELGQRLDTNYEILSGLTAGQEVVTAGQTRLVEGTPVQIIKN
ncbi:MAG: efflux RND transporter periplasmic adaptor subunit [Candidatus Symbiothrix sp.]|jgi:RND family efflux transporter MFP subunit|nr:efflux RND transporter periplasmic adaptor subunit [Candidatus Symbiothrix sp.]